MTVAPLPDDSNRRKTVLVVEDDVDVMASLVSGLVDHGFDILEAAGADEALSLCVNSKATIGVAVVDMAMPGMWGDEFAQWLSLVSPDTIVIFISGHTEDFLRLGGSLTGDDIFFPKPFAIKLMVQKIRELLGLTEHSDLRMEIDRRVE